jgi:iron complex outermembrane receptor protein
MTAPVAIDNTLGRQMNRQLRVVSAAAAALVAGIASAQSADAPAKDAAGQQRAARAPQGAASGADAAAATTVVVTSSRPVQAPIGTGALGSRSELETPFSIRQVTDAELEDRMVKSLGKVFAEDAAVMSLGDTYSFNNYSINVRGIPLDDYNGYKINGQPFFMTTVELPLESFESVQLLKGASGFMYGFGAPGGIINFVTKKPTDTTTFSVDEGYRSSGVFSEHVDAGGRVGPDDRFGYRVNLTHEDGSTYNHSKVHRDSGSLSVDARISPSLTWTADAIYQERDITGGVQDFMLDPSSYVGTSLPKAISGKKDLSTAYKDTYFNSDVFYLSTGLNWKIDSDWTASISGSRSQDHRRYSGQWMALNDSAGNYDVYLNKAQGTADYGQSQATLEGKFATGALKHQVTLGLAWQGLAKKTVPSSLYTDIGSENLYEAVTPLTWSGTYDYSAQYRNYTSSQKAVFASDTLTLADWSLLAGLRYTDYNQTSYNKTTGAATPYSKKPVTPTVALMFRPNAETLVYASYVAALEDGGTVGTSYSNHDESLAPISSKQFELGTKYDATHWGASAALFQIDRGAQYGPVGGVYANDGQERLRGLELNGHVDLPHGFQVSNSSSWETGTYRGGDPTIAGNRVEGIPRFQSTLQVSDKLPGLESVTVNGEAHFLGHMDADATNSFRMPSVTLFNAGLTYRTQLNQHSLTLRGGVDNLFNRSYWGFLASDYIFVGAPRTVSVNARIDF